MTPKQREAFDLLTLQLVERGYLRADLLAPGLHGPGLPGVWIPICNGSLVVFDAVRMGRSGGGWEIQVSAPDCGADQLACKVAAFDQDGERIWANDGAAIAWEGLDLALRWAEDLAAQVGEVWEVA